MAQSRETTSEAGALAVVADTEVDALDAALVAAARANPSAFRQLYERYVDQVYHYCYVRLGSREAAEDATSEIVMRALKHLPSQRGDSFAGWLFTIARNVVAEQHRRRYRGPTVMPIEAAGAVPDADPLPEDAAVARSRQEELHRALAGLPDDQRALVELQLSGLTTPQIAVALQRSQGAVRMLRLRAFGRLRGLLVGSGLATEQGELR